MRRVHQDMLPEALQEQDRLHLAHAAAVLQVVHPLKGLQRAFVAVHAADAQRLGEGIEAAGGQEAQHAEQAAEHANRAPEALLKAQLVPEGLAKGPSLGVKCRVACRIEAIGMM